MNVKVILLTGASSGIGYNTAEHLVKEGYTVYGAARRTDQMPVGVKPVKLDITNEESIQACIEQVMQAEGHIDVLINNAGYGSYGAIEDITIEEAKRQLEVNLFGLANLTKQVLPIMRQQKSGTIINISSMGGRVSTLFGGWYHASKYALEGFSDCLRMEVAAFGIDVVLIEPGGVKTDWGMIAADHLADSSKGGAYENQALKTSANMKRQYSSNMLSNPNIIAKTIAKTIAKAIKSRRPKTRYLIGFGAKPIVFMKTILPDRLYDKIMRNM